MTRIYTIGHSKHTLEKLVQLLKDNGVTMLVDVRTAPYSRFCPWFNKDDLEFELPRRQVQYQFAGKHLGGRPSDASLYKSNKIPEEEGVDYLHEVNYPEIMKRPWFEQAIERLLETAEQEVVAILCSEENPADCHRHHLIARYLLEYYPEIEVIHIRGDGVTFGAASIHKSVDKPTATQTTMF